MSKNLSRFINDLPGVLSFHKIAATEVRSILSDPSHPSEVKEIFHAQMDEIGSHLYLIESAGNKFVTRLVGQPFQKEIEKQLFELFPDSTITDSKIQYTRIKIVYEWVSSFLKVAESSWNSIIVISKIFTTYNETSKIQEKLQQNFLSRVFELNQDTKQFLSYIERSFNCRIIGAFAKDKEILVSNIIFEDDKTYDINTIISNDLTDLKFKPVAKPSFGNKVSKSEFYVTEVKGTKDWNRNDSYILLVKGFDLKEEEQKFYTSSFVILNPSDNANINLAAALVRKNTGYSTAPKYNKMVTTLLEFAVTNIITKDFTELCEDTHTFMYHIGPVVLWNIIQEDMIRRDFGYCYYVDKNNIIKFFPENIIKKLVIDFWADKFHDIKSANVDSYINYSKGVANVRESYKILFDLAASTRKRITTESIPIEDYLKDNSGKFFGYRRAQVYRRFVNDSIWGQLPENSSVDLINKFARK